MDRYEIVDILWQLRRMGTLDLEEALTWVATPHPDLHHREPIDSSWGDVVALLRKNEKQSA